MKPFVKMREICVLWLSLSFLAALSECQVSGSDSDSDVTVFTGDLELKRQVLNVYNKQYWLLLFHHDSCRKCVFKSLDALSFAHWIKGEPLGQTLWLSFRPSIKIKHSEFSTIFHISL